MDVVSGCISTITKPVSDHQPTRRTARRGQKSRHSTRGKHLFRSIRNADSSQPINRSIDHSNSRSSIEYTNNKRLNRDVWMISNRDDNRSRVFDFRSAKPEAKSHEPKKNRNTRVSVLFRNTNGAGTRDTHITITITITITPHPLPHQTQTHTNNKRNAHKNNRSPRVTIF